MDSLINILGSALRVMDSGDLSDREASCTTWLNTSAYRVDIDTCRFEIHKAIEQALPNKPDTHPYYRNRLARCILAQLQKDALDMQSNTLRLDKALSDAGTKLQTMTDSVATVEAEIHRYDDKALQNALQACCKHMYETIASVQIPPIQVSAVPIHLLNTVPAPLVNGDRDWDTIQDENTYLVMEKVTLLCAANKTQKTALRTLTEATQQFTKDVKLAVKDYHLFASDLKQIVFQTQSA